MPLDQAAMTAVDTAAPVANHRGCYSIRWACVYTQPQAETWANSNLQRNGYRTWFPTHVIRQRDRVTPTLIHLVTRPLFPRYGFIAFDHRDTSWSPIRATPGVIDLVRCGSQPAYTNATAVEALRAATDLLRAQLPQESLYRPGAACDAILGGGVKVEGVVMSVTGQRAIVTALMFGQLREVTVDLSNLRSRDE